MKLFPAFRATPYNAKTLLHFVRVTRYRLDSFRLTEVACVVCFSFFLKRSTFNLYVALPFLFPFSISLLRRFFNRSTVIHGITHSDLELTFEKLDDVDTEWEVIKYKSKEKNDQLVKF